MSIKKTYQINTNRGVDLTSSPLNVSHSRASYMRNMINEGGINKKRHGWNEIAYFENPDGNTLPVNGIWEYKHPDTGDKSLIVYAGTSFFKCNYDFTAQEEIDVESDAEVNGEKCRAYYKDGLLWLIGCGDYLVYDGESIQKVENSKYAYAPITMLNLTPSQIHENDESVTFEASGGVTYEDVNLFTRKRRNKLIGKTGSYKSVTYELDGKIDYCMPIKITIDVIPSGKPKNDNEIAVYAKYKDNNEKVTDIVTLTYQTSEYEEKGQLSKYSAFCNGKEVSLYTKGEESVEIEFSAIVRLFNHERGQITFYFPVSTYIDGYSNITVEYYADYERSIGLTASAVYAQANGVDLLLVANRGNAIFYNGLDSIDCEYSFGYIPVEKFITFGTDREEITAIVPMADGVGVFKGKSFYRVAFTFTSDSETYTAEYVPQITEAADGNGCVNQFVAYNVNGDTVIFDGTGVYGIEITSQQRVLKLRSSNISKVFEQYSDEEINSAVAVEHEGRYYLFITGDVYIADSRFKVYESGRLDTSFEYEWWVWDNCPASIVCSIGGKLYMGRENGKIAVFDKEYKDRELLIARSSKNEVVCTTDEGPSMLTFDEEFGVMDGDKIQISCGRKLLYNGVIPQYNNKITIPIKNNLLGFYIGQTVYVLSQNKYCKITDFNAEFNCFVLDCDYQGVFHDSIYEDVSCKKFILDKILGESGFLICERNKNQELKAISLEDYEGFFVIVERERNVECEYHTPALDLGSNLSLKILNQLLITVSNDTEGAIDIGYQTNNNNRYLSREIGAGLDFGNFNFNSLSFDGSFYKTYIKRVFERNFNYICFKFASYTDKSFGVENFSCVYTMNNKVIRGDR